MEEAGGCTELSSSELTQQGNRKPSQRQDNAVSAGKRQNMHMHSLVSRIGGHLPFNGEIGRQIANTIATKIPAMARPVKLNVATNPMPLGQD